MQAKLNRNIILLSLSSRWYLTIQTLGVTLPSLSEGNMPELTIVNGLLSEMQKPAI